MIHIKISIPGFGNSLRISQYLGNSENRYKNCQFHINEPDLECADFWFILDDLQKPFEKVNVNRENVYFLSAEVVHTNGYYDSPDKVKFLDQFPHIMSCHDIFRDNASYEIPFLPWMINANHGPSIFEDTIRDVNWLMGMQEIDKSKSLSVFCSAKTITPEHNTRIKLVRKLKEHFGDRLDWFGNGVQSIDRKWDGIAPYKYHIALENKSRHNIITEKIYDSYLGLAYPIYAGAPNISDYFSKDSFTPIEIQDWRGAIDTIESVMDQNLWEKRFSSLLDSKVRVLTDYNVFYRIAQVAIDADTKRSQYQQISLLSSEQIKLHEMSYLDAVVVKGGQVLQRLGKRLELGRIN